jgi:hypothetical protein
VRIYGPRPAAGTEFESWSTVSEDSQRQHTQFTDIIGRDGRLWARLTAVKCWRFYLPFGDINFHGPKDQYFLGVDWPQAFPTPADPTARRAACVKLEPPRDLLQVGMRLVTAHVTMSPEELAEFLRLTLPEKDKSTWLFTRIAAKEAIRYLWRDTRDRRLFPADIPITLDSDGRPVAGLRDEETPADFPNIAWAYLGTFMAGLASFTPELGVALVRIESHAEDWEAARFDANELTLLAGSGLARDRAVSAAEAAKQAVAQALAIGDAERSQLKVMALDAASGAACVVSPGHGGVVAYTWAENDLVVATTIGERVE